MGLAAFLHPFVLALSLASPSTAAPAAAPDVHAARLDVRVEIVDGVATTHLSQVLTNDAPRVAEATWILPLPEGAVADGFELTVDGVAMSGDVLDAARARGVYERIVRSRRDPGLLEYFGRGCLRARVFPLPKDKPVTVEISYRQLLPERSGLMQWSFPMHAAGIGGREPALVTLDLSIQSTKPLRNAYSPVPLLHIVQKDDHAVRVSFEGPPARLPAGELSVFYGLSEAEFGLNVLSHRAKDAAEGTFLMLLAPKREWDLEKIEKKHVTFVLDTSGSMDGAKIQQARGALRHFLSSLRPGDRFDVIPFSTEPLPFFSEPMAASPEHVAKALEKVERVRAEGGTNISAALGAGLRRGKPAADEVPILVFLTDGLPTLGTTETAKLLDQARASNAHATRIFVFGVGDDVDTQLLDALARDGRGARDYVRPNEDIEVKTSALFAKLSHPVMSDLELVVDGLTLTRLVPATLTDLFRGERIQILGRYAEAGQHAVRLRGRVQGQQREYVYEATFAPAGDVRHDFVPALWAERRVGVLLDAMRLNGQNPELFDEVVRLGREFHIVTPYTSHLILEEGLELDDGFLGGPVGAPGGSGGAGRGGHRGGTYRGPGDTGAPSTGGGGGGPGSPGAPGSPRSGATSTGAEGFFLGRGQKEQAQRPPSLVELAKRLREAGVLPENASKEELAALATEVARELSQSRADLDELGRERTGAGAVDDSAYLARLVAEGGGDDARLLQLFARRVRAKVFFLRQGVWKDRAALALEEGDPKERSAPAHTVVEAWSPAYFALLDARPGLRPYFAFSSRLLVLFEGELFEVVLPKAEAKR